MGDGLSKRWLFSLCFEQLVHIGWSGGAGLECYSWEHKLVCRRQWHGRVSSMLRLWRGCHNPLPKPSSKSLHESVTKPFPSPEPAIEWEPAGTPWVECSEFGHVCRPGTLSSLAEELAHARTLQLCLQRLRDTSDRQDWTAESHSSIMSSFAMPWLSFPREPSPLHRGLKAFFDKRELHRATWHSVGAIADASQKSLQLASLESSSGYVCVKVDNLALSCVLASHRHANSAWVCGCRHRGTNLYRVGF